jgi:hypothetical protein
MERKFAIPLNLTTKGFNMKKYVLALLVLLALASSASAQSWNYLAYAESPHTLRQIDEGWVTLEEKNGVYSFVWFLPNMSKCYKGVFEAQVTKTIALTTITVPALVTGCLQTRITIRNDGTGGYRSTFNESTGKWSRDSKERKLTPKT